MATEIARGCGVEIAPIDGLRVGVKADEDAAVWSAWEWYCRNGERYSGEPISVSHFLSNLSVWLRCIQPPDLHSGWGD